MLTYLQSLSHDLIDEKLAAAYIDAGPPMVRWLESSTPVRFEIVEGFPDYHPEHPGGKPGGGRSLECPLFPFDELGPWAEKVTVGPQMGRNITMSETPLGRGAPGGVPPTSWPAARCTTSGAPGRAWSGRLLKGCLDRGIEPRTGAAARELIVERRQGGRRPLRRRERRLRVGGRGGRHAGHGRLRVEPRPGAQPSSAGR